ncbi:MAG: Mur ligase family protein [Proteobacteria bacterium]|nr:Mur ligase family protein [Pseudomonadota bacterium]
MLDCILIFIGKCISYASALFHLGNGSTWPGHIALRINPFFIKNLITKNKLKIIIITGTNGKTTTASMLTHILTENGYKVFLNNSGANLLNGIASSIIITANLQGKLKSDYAIFEIDENALSAALLQMTPDFLVLLDLFRDQLDRYGEIWTIANRWENAIKKLPPQTCIISNADDPKIAFIGVNSNKKTRYYGLLEQEQDQEHHSKCPQYASDSLYCPQCGKKLNYHIHYYSHLGDYYCGSCEFKRPSLNVHHTEYPLVGMYNKYNALAATLTALEIGLNEPMIHKANQSFTPVFGRQEILEVSGKHVQLFLAKNPTSFNEAYQTIVTLGAKFLCISLNDRTPDGTDVSWIWDFDLPNLGNFSHIFLTGDRVYDLGLRLKYEDSQHFTLYTNPKEAIHEALSMLPNNETLFVLPTYSAMLDIREIIIGKRIQ